jgi:hypothetical protein
MRVLVTFEAVADRMEDYDEFRDNLLKFLRENFDTGAEIPTLNIKPLRD